MFSLTYLPQNHEFKVFIFLLGETEMAQNNSLFVWKTSNYSPNLKIKLEKWHEPSNKSETTGFYTEKNSKITRSFSWGSFMRHRLQWFLWCCFWSSYFFNRPSCGRPCCETSIICISCWSRWFTNTNPKKLTAFTSPSSTSYIGEQSS